MTKITQKEDEIGDMAYVEMIDRDTLARYLINKPRAAIPQPVLDSAEQMLLFAERRSKARFAAAQQKATTPTKTTNAAILLNPFKIELKNLVKQKSAEYKANNNTTTIPQAEVDKIIAFYKKEIQAHDLAEKILSEETKLGRNFSQAELNVFMQDHDQLFSGLGLKKQTRII